MLLQEGDFRLAHQFYHTHEFAKKSSVSVRTLQFYDKKGLLSPSAYTRSGYRLYSEDDLVRLQQILALKYLGFTLMEIRNLIRLGANELSSALTAQKEMLLGKRQQIDAIITAIEKIEMIETENFDYEAIVKIIEAIQVDLKSQWINRYLSSEESKTLEEIAEKSFSDEALQKLAQQEYTEEMHQQYCHFYDEVRRLAAQDTDPASQEAQQLAQYLTDLNKQRSQGWNQELLTGMKKSWETFNSLPEGKKPQVFALTVKETAFIRRACLLLYEQKSPDG